MSRLAIIERTKLNLAEVTILLKGGVALEVDVLVQVFAGFGARNVRRADTFEAAKEAIGAEQIDLMVIDAGGGLKESLEVVRTLRRTLNDSRYAPVVLTTTNPVTSLLQEARDMGVNFVVAKPLTPRVLFERLIWIVKDARPFIETEAYVGPDRRVRMMGPPLGMPGRRAGDLSAELGAPAAPNMSQADIDAMMSGMRKSG